MLFLVFVFCCFCKFSYFQTYLQECSYRMGKEKRLKEIIIFLHILVKIGIYLGPFDACVLAEFERQQHASTILLEDRVNYSVEDIFS